MRTLTIVSIALWLGMLGFFAFAVAPGGFRHPGPSQRGAPGLGGAVALVLGGSGAGNPGVAGIVARGNRGGRRWSDRLAAGAGTSHAVADRMVLVRAHAGGGEPAGPALAARRGQPHAPDALRFGRIHGLSTMAGLAVMLSGAVLLARGARESEVPCREVSCREVP